MSSPARRIAMSTCEWRIRTSTCVRVATMAPGDPAGTMDAFELFSRDLDALALPNAERDPELDLSCDLVPLEEAAK